MSGAQVEQALAATPFAPLLLRAGFFRLFFQNAGRMPKGLRRIKVVGESSRFDLRCAE
jgi:hypothetical protein